MKVGKPISKRVPVRLRHKIQKKSAAKQRKERREAKKKPQWRSRLKKDPGIPNLFPYKDRILAEIEENKRRKAEEHQKRRETAKAQRQGTAVNAVSVPAPEDDEDEDGLIDRDSIEEHDEMEVQDESNPMAALLASAQARASAYSKDDDDGDDDEDEQDDDEWDGVDDATTSAPGQAPKKALPKQALADPITAVSALLDRMQKTTDGMQRLTDHYNLPPLVTAGSDTTSRFLVEVARKRGRLGRGGVPNLNAAALTVLDDLNQERLHLPAVENVAASAKKAGNKSEVQIVAQMAAPFRIEGLFGDGIAEACEPTAMT